MFLILYDEFFHCLSESQLSRSAASPLCPNFVVKPILVFRCVQTEIDYLNGFLVREGRRLKVPVTCSETITSLVKACESSRKLKLKAEEDLEELPELSESGSGQRTTVVRTIAEFRSLSRGFAKAGKFSI